MDLKHWRAQKELRNASAVGSRLAGVPVNGDGLGTYCYLFLEAVAFAMC